MASPERRRRCVVQLISNLEYGGAQRYVVELANSLNPAQFDVHVCSLSTYVPLADDLTDPGRRLHIIRKRQKYDVTVVFRLARLLRHLRADVVHSYLFDAEIAGRLAGRLVGTPLIVGTEGNCSSNFKRRQLLAYWLTRRCVDRIIANSNSGLEFNSRTLGHPRAMYRVVLNGVNTTRFRPAPAQQGEVVRQELGIAPGARVIGMFASFKPQKNQALLVDALAQLSHRCPSACVLFVGDVVPSGVPGSQACKQRVQHRVEELGLRPRCVFLGNRLDVERLYPACDVTVLPSAAEGTSNALLESMACGVPVVASDVSDNRQLIPNGRVGYVVPVGDAGALAERIAELLADEPLRVQMGQQARTWADREFSTVQMAEKTAAVYSEALGSLTDARTKRVRG